MAHLYSREYDDRSYRCILNCSVVDSRVIGECSEINFLYKTLIGIRRLNTDMDNLSPIICSTEIRDMDRNEFKERVLSKVKYKQVLDRIKLQY